VVRPSNFRHVGVDDGDRLKGQDGLHRNARVCPAGGALLVDPGMKQEWSVRETTEWLGLSERG